MYKCDILYDDDYSLKMFNILQNPHFIVHSIPFNIFFYFSISLDVWENAQPFWNRIPLKFGVTWFTKWWVFSTKDINYNPMYTRRPTAEDYIDYMIWTLKFSSSEGVKENWKFNSFHMDTSRPVVEQFD